MVDGGRKFEGRDQPHGTNLKPSSTCHSGIPPCDLIFPCDPVSSNPNIDLHNSNSTQKTTMEALRKRAASLMFVEPSKPESVGNDRASSASPTKEKSSMQEEDHEEPSLPATGRRDVSFQDSISIGTQEANSELGRPKLRYLPRQ